MGHSIPRLSSTSSSSSTFQETSPEHTAILDLDLHRYPSPTHIPIKERIAALRGAESHEQVFLGVGSDEIIDLLIRVLVRPSSGEKVLICPPTYGMYKVCAAVNDVPVLSVPLVLDGRNGEGGENGRFSLDVDAVKTAIANEKASGGEVKLVFLCSPGNPTGTKLSLGKIRQVLECEALTGVVVVDEAYVDFAGEETSAVELVREYKNVVVMQTLSKGFGLAAIRLGIAISQPPLIQILSNTKAPYNIPTPTAHLALRALSTEAVASMREKVATLIAERTRLIQVLPERLGHLGVGSAIGGNDANFIMLPILSSPEGPPDSDRAERVYRLMAEERLSQPQENGVWKEGAQGPVVVRFRGREPGCEGCLRVTVGTREENDAVLEKLGGILGRVVRGGQEGGNR